jgi:hypothetical protein
LADTAAVSVVATADASSGGESVGDPVQARADSAVAVIGTPALALELATPPGLIEVGKRASFQVRVRNPGTVSVRTVEVVATAPAELKPVSATGKGEGRIDAGGKVTFPTLDELRPGETATFTVQVEAVQAGDARFHAEVKAAHLKNPLTEEQAARVVGGK